MASLPSLNLLAAAFTPFDQNGKINTTLIFEYYQHLLKSGVTGVFVCGTTGEFTSLSVAERKELSEAWVKANSGHKNFKVIVHVGHEDIRAAQELAKHASEIGADGFSTLSPVFYKVSSMEHALNHAALIASSAPDLPFYYYYLPSASGFYFSLIDFVESAIKTIPNFRGVKYTHENLGEVIDYHKNFGSEIKFFFGRDELLLAGIIAGCTTALGSTYNFASKLYFDMHRAIINGDFECALQLQKNARKLINAMLQAGGLAGLKYGMEHIGISCGPCRHPLAQLGETQKRKLSEIFSEFVA